MSTGTRQNRTSVKRRDLSLQFPCIISVCIVGSKHLRSFLLKSICVSLSLCFAIFKFLFLQVCTCVRGTRVWGCIPQVHIVYERWRTILDIIFWFATHLLGGRVNLPKLVQMTREAQGSACLCLPRGGIRNTHHCIQHFSLMSGEQPKILMFAKQSLYTGIYVYTCRHLQY